MFKKIFILLLIAILTISCSAVSAGDIDNTSDINIPTIESSYAPIQDNTPIGDNNISKTDSFVKIESQNITIDDNETISITLPENATGKIFVNFENEISEINITSSKLNYTLANLAYGNYTINITYSGDDAYLESSNSTEFSVSKLYAMCNVDFPRQLYADENLTLVITALSDETGTVSFTFRNETRIGEFENGSMNTTFTNLSEGTYNITLVYSGSDRYYGRNGTFFITVFKRDSQIRAASENITVGSTETIHVNVTGNATGNVTLTINNENYTENIDNSQAIFTIDNLAQGEYTADIIYNGDNVYETSTTTTTFTVSKIANISLEITSEDITVGESEHISVKVNDNATGNITVTINNINYTSSINNGIATFIINNLEKGDYTIFAAYSGDEKYVSNSTTSKFTVNELESDTKEETVNETENNTDNEIRATVNETENSTDNKVKKSSELVNTNIKTANPIFILLIVLITMGLIPFKRK